MSFRAIQNGPRVLILVNGKLLADLDCDAAIETGKAFLSVGRSAQEVRDVEKVAQDSALLLRVSGLGLAHNQAVASEAYKRAQWDRGLRKVRAIEGIPSESKVGRPSLINRKRKEHADSG